METKKLSTILTRKLFKRFKTLKISWNYSRTRNSKSATHNRVAAGNGRYEWICHRSIGWSMRREWDVTRGRDVPISCLMTSCWLRHRRSIAGRRHSPPALAIWLSYYISTVTYSTLLKRNSKTEDRDLSMQTVILIHFMNFVPKASVEI